MAKQNIVFDGAESEQDEKTEGKEHELKEIRDRYSKASEYWATDREAARDDIRFRAGEQWPQDIAAKRKTDQRPCLTVDKLSQYVRQIVNDGRQNRPSIKVRPVDSGADVATAEVFQGAIKHIEDQSGADAAYDTALDCAATCGQGYFRVLTDYVGDETFNQDIYIKRIRNPLSVMIDPDSQEADGSDMRFAFVTEEVSKEDFKAQYPGKYPEDFKSDKDYGDWFGDHVRVAEYWYVEEEDRELCLLQDGKVIARDKLEVLKSEGFDIDSEIVETRNVPKRTVMHCKVSGRDYLTEPTEWAGKYIPILIVWGNEIDVEGEVIHSGIIRPGKDPQRLYNYSRSAFAERVALTPKAPWVAAEGQVEDYSDNWETANTENHSVLRYRPVSLHGQPVPPPQRTSATDVPVGFQQDMQISEHDIQGAIGMYAASLGAPSNERSGKAILARQKEGDVGTFHYHDNLNRAIRHCGRILVDLIPKIYDTARIVRILGYDGTPTQVDIDPALPSASQKLGVKMAYNLGVGTYDVSISTGPSYNTLRQEAAESMVEMVQANPALMGVIGDLMVKNMDWPGAEEISERLKLTLPPEIQQAEQAKKQGDMPPEMQQAVAQFDQAIKQKDEQLTMLMDEFEQMKSENEQLKADYAIKQQEVQIKAKDTEIKAFTAETARLSTEAQIENDRMQLIVQAQQNEQQAQQQMQQPDTQIAPEPQMDIAQILQAIAAMQQPINITVPVTVDGKGQTVKQGRAVRQMDGSYMMESIETPMEGC